MALALYLVLIDVSLGDAALNTVKSNFVKSIQDNDCALLTGFLGTGVLLDALVKIDRSDIAFKVLTNKTRPG